jgi:hypothetical protein
VRLKRIVDVQGFADDGPDGRRIILDAGGQAEDARYLVHILEKLQGQFTTLMRRADFERQLRCKSAKAHVRQAPEIVHWLERQWWFGKVKYRQGALV